MGGETPVDDGALEEAFISEEHKAMVRRIIEEIFHAGNLEVVDEIFATDYIDHNPSDPELLGIQNIKRSVSD